MTGIWKLLYTSVGNYLPYVLYLCPFVNYFLQSCNFFPIILLQMPILDMSEERRNSSRPESESDFEEIHPGLSF